MKQRKQLKFLAHVYLPSAFIKRLALCFEKVALPIWVFLSCIVKSLSIVKVVLSGNISENGIVAFIALSENTTGYGPEERVCTYVTDYDLCVRAYMCCIGYLSVFPSVYINECTIYTYLN